MMWLCRYLLLAVLLGAPAIAAAAEVLRLATTTSLENSGLLAYLLPDFERRCRCRMHVIPVGTGKALALGRRGDADVLLVHAPAAEADFIAAGYGIVRQPIAYNYFLLLSPESDPANAAASSDIFAALDDIIAARALFLSRGDDSGTHKKELALWRRLEEKNGGAVVRSSDWYIESGSGMGQAIVMADELGAYTLSDVATYLHFSRRVRLVPLKLPPAQTLYNPYSVIQVNPARHPHIQTELAEQFTAWLSEPATRQRIADYRLFGEPVFFPLD